MVVAQHPAIRACVAVGIADARVGERIIVAFEPNDGSVVDVSDLGRFCADRLSRFEQPDEFVPFEQLPRTFTQKVARDQVRAQLSGSAA